MVYDIVDTDVKRKRWSTRSTHFSLHRRQLVGSRAANGSSA
jgi:hypothetical protein